MLTEKHLVLEEQFIFSYYSTLITLVAYIFISLHSRKGNKVINKKIDK